MQKQFKDNKTHFFKTLDTSRPWDKESKREASPLKILEVARLYKWMYPLCESWRFEFQTLAAFKINTDVFKVYYLSVSI